MFGSGETRSPPVASFVISSSDLDENKRIPEFGPIAVPFSGTRHGI
jgi:hypothetical protein